MKKNEISKETIEKICEGQIVNKGDESFFSQFCNDRSE